MSESVYPPPLVTGREAPVHISTFDLEMVGPEFRTFSGLAPSSNNWPAVNLAIFVPLYLSSALIAYQLYLGNGAAVAGNVDMGIFDEAGTMLVSKGSTAQAGASGFQFLNITDTPLAANTRYYIGISTDTSGITQKIQGPVVPQAGIGQMMGLAQMASAFPLANATFAAYAQVLVPMCGLTGRATA